MPRARIKKVIDDQIITVTQEAYDEMVAELEELINVKRPEIADRLKDARSLGDLKENYDYTNAMEEKELNETRIAELEDRIKKAQVVKSIKTDNVVQIGEKIEILNCESNEKRIVVLVGSEETQAANPLEGKLSIDSPIGKAILNARIGDEVDVKLPGKTVKYKVLKIN
jgi:transcription elongation factor GreA